MDFFAGYVHLHDGTAEVARTVEIAADLMVDVDAEDRVLGVEVLSFDVDWRDALVILAMRGRLRVDKPLTADLYSSRQAAGIKQTAKAVKTRPKRSRHDRNQRSVRVRYRNT